MNLLIVDDDIPTTEVVRDLIKGRNLPIKEVTAVYTVLEAKSVLEKQRVDLRAVFSELLASLYTDFTEAGFEMEVDLPSDLPPSRPTRGACS